MSKRLPMLLPALFFLAAVLSYSIEKNFHKVEFSFNLDNSLYRILGSAKEAIGDTLFLKADAYLHGGVEGKSDSGEDLEKEGKIEEREHSASGLKTASDWIAQVNDRVKVHEHRHLAKTQQKEILPFIYWATELDPHNVEAVLTAAYWLDRHLGQTDSAVEVLAAGLRNNPGHWEIEQGLADIYFKRKKDAILGERFYAKAIEDVKDKEKDRHSLIELYYFLGESRLSLKKKSGALRAYQMALALYAANEENGLKVQIMEKIKELS